MPEPIQPTRGPVPSPQHDPKKAQVSPELQKTADKTTKFASGFTLGQFDPNKKFSASKNPAGKTAAPPWKPQAASE